MQHTKRICLWSSPRNISTALMYSFAQREDTMVIDEPLYAYYLKVTNADHPGREEVIASMESDGKKVVSKIILGDYEKPVVFMKQMSHHLLGLDESFLEKVINVFLIREPSQLISSFAQVVSSVSMTDIGVKKQYELFEKLQSSGSKPVVIDSVKVLENPERTLSGLCHALGISFDKKMLSWKKGPRHEDGVWAKYWYSNVHNSTCFTKQKTSERKLPENLRSLYEECIPYYEKLREISI